MVDEKNSFPPHVVEQLKTYVYRLIDPRNGETFYVGKGKGNRVFAHAAAEIDTDAPDDRLKRIREIKLSGLLVGHVIHRHGMDSATALEVEAALMDAYPGLTNIAGGTGSGDYGSMHAFEIITRYSAEPAVFVHRALLINVGRTSTEKTLYEATRFAWVIKPRKAAMADVILPTRLGMILGAFVAERWLPATADNFPGHEPVPKRFGFVGHEAPPELAKPYVGKRVPEAYRKRGASNPIKYTWK